jgi:hypothetical protein
VRRILPSLLFVICLLSVVTNGTGLSGTWKYPNGGTFSGRASFQLQKSPLQDTCFSPAVVVGTTPFIQSIVGGVMTPTLTGTEPTDCLSIFTPYAVQVYDGQNHLITTANVWLTGQGGGIISPSNGNKYIYPSGMIGVLSGTPAAFFLPQNYTAGFQKVSANTGTVTTGSNATISLSWPRLFTDALYTVACNIVTSHAAVQSYQLQPTSFGTITISGLSVVVHNFDSVSRSGVVVCHGREP